MTTDDAIKRLEIIATNLCGQSAQNQNLWQDYKAVDMAISALRSQQEREHPKPLSMDELRQMNGEPVYIVFGDVSWWDIVRFCTDAWVDLYIEDCMFLSTYGKTWMAYRNKLEEDIDD